MKRKSAVQTGGGASPHQRRSERKNRQPSGKISSKNAVSDLEPGAPEIAHPDDQVKWQTQRSFVIAWVFEVLDRVECNDENPAREARAELKNFFLNSGGQLLGIAQARNDSNATDWAGRVLAHIFVNVGKHVGKVRIKKP